MPRLPIAFPSLRWCLFIALVAFVLVAATPFDLILHPAWAQSPALPNTAAAVVVPPAGWSLEAFISTVAMALLPPIIGFLGWLAQRAQEKHNNRMAISVALPRAAGAALSYAQQNKIDLTTRQGWNTMVQAGAAYMLQNLPAEIESLGGAGKLSSWVSGALGDKLGASLTGIVDVPALTGLSQATMGVAQTIEPIVHELSDGAVGKIADAVTNLPLSPAVLSTVVKAVVDQTVPSAEAVAKRVLAGIPSLTGTVQAGLRLAEATEQDLLTELVSRRGLTVQPVDPAPAPPADAAADASPAADTSTTASTSTAAS